MLKNFFSRPKGKGRVKKNVKGVFSHFDSRIFIVFAGVALVGIAIFITKSRGYVDCEQIDFYVTNNLVGDVIDFQNETPNAKNWRWDFGDGGAPGYRKRAFHTYDKPGVYNVKLTVNDFCTKERKIEIKYPDELIGGGKIPKIIAPQSAYVGEKVHFNHAYPGEVFSLEWRFGETARLDATDKAPDYVYRNPGEKTISLIINSNVQYMATKTLFVKPAEPENEEEDETTSYVYDKQPEAYELPPGEPQKDPLDEQLENTPLVPPSEQQTEVEEKKELPKIAPEISEEQFELLLKKVAAESKTKEDFATYFCEHYNKITVIKNKDEFTNFTELCQSIKGREIKIKALRLIKNDLNCIVTVDIRYAIKRFPGFWWSKG